MLIVKTVGFSKEIPEEKQANILALTLKRITPQTDFLIFDPAADKEEMQDEGRSLMLPMKGIPKKVYAKLDDYGDAETLRQWSGLPDVNTRYAVTLMLAEEY